MDKLIKYMCVDLTQALNYKVNYDVFIPSFIINVFQIIFINITVIATIIINRIRVFFFLL